MIFVFLVFFLFPVFSIIFLFALFALLRVTVLSSPLFSGVSYVLYHGYFSWCYLAASDTGSHTTGRHTASCSTAPFAYGYNLLPSSIEAFSVACIVACFGTTG